MVRNVIMVLVNFVHILQMLGGKILEDKNAGVERWIVEWRTCVHDLLNYVELVP